VPNEITKHDTSIVGFGKSVRRVRFQGGLRCEDKSEVGGVWEEAAGEEAVERRGLVVAV
jgi:hypothetical protein